MSAALAMDYPRLLSETQPEVVHDETLNERFINALRKLDDRWDSLSTEEKKLHELLVLLIQDFETRTYKIHAATPIEVIEELIAANDLTTESVVSEVLSGKRRLTVDHIKRLSERFSVSPAVFF